MMKINNKQCQIYVYSKLSVVLCVTKVGYVN